MSGIVTAARRQTELTTLWSANAGDYVVKVALASTGQWCLIGTGAGLLSCRDMGTGQEAFCRQAHSGGILDISMAPDATRFVTCGQDGAARVWSAQGELLGELASGTRAWVEHVAWSPSGDRIATSGGCRVRMWTPAGELISESAALESTVTGLAWRSDGTGLAACCYGGLHLWPFVPGARERHLPWKGSLISLAWSPDAKVIACGSQDRSVHFWRLAQGEDSEMCGYPCKPRALAWDSESKLLATAGAAEVTVWDFRGKGPEGTRPLQLEGHVSMCTELAFAPRQSLLASGSQDGSVLLWTPRRNSRPTRHAFLEEEVTALAWHPERPALLGADARGTVTFWELS